MVGMRLWFLLLLGVYLTPLSCIRDAERDPDRMTLRRFERLSLDLRGRRLDRAERASLAAALSTGDAGAVLYSGRLREWMTKDALKRYVDTFFRFPPTAVVMPDAETFFHRLSSSGDGTRALYYLSHTLEEPEEGLSSPDTPCPPGSVVGVRAWWQDEELFVCEASYRPESVFDDLGYCSGEAEPLMRQPPREECGCGPMLIGCLPPMGENPRLDALVRSSVVDEWYETAARIVAGDGPLDELVTTSRTWQTGLIEFLYLRREIIGELYRTPWSPELGRGIEDLISGVDVYRPGRWVERGGIYQGTGIWWTAMASHALKIPVRGTAHHLLSRYLGADFHAVNVDADAVLRAVGEQNENIRTLSSVTESPMRTQLGCRGCHAPMDGAAGFLSELQAPLYGSFPTGLPGNGEFFVTGAADFRGQGSGIAALSAFVVSQPEFETTAVRRAFEEVLLRPLRNEDQELFEELVVRFRDNGHRWKEILEQLFLSDAYLYPSVVPPSPSPDAADDGEPAAVPDFVAGVLDSICVECHDATHSLDLRTPPARSDASTWTRILTRTRDYSMPPPVFTGAVTGRFPMDPGERRRFTAEVAEMLGGSVDPPVVPRRLDHRGWHAVAREVALTVLPESAVAELLAPVDADRTILHKLPPRGYVPAYQTALNQASELLCGAIASVESSGGTGTYGLQEGDWDEKDRRVAVSTLLGRVYGGDPDAADVTEAVGILEDFHAITANWVTAWTGLCSAHLSGPRLMYELYMRGDGGEDGEEAL